MNIHDLARLAVEACDQGGVDYMLTGAFATGCYGIPRATRDVDLVLATTDTSDISQVISAMDAEVSFAEQVQFDTITWGKRHVGTTKNRPFLKIELFELFDDPVVVAQFERRKKMVVPTLGVTTFVPTAEDVIIQKLRWARDKDLLDALDVIIVQQPENLDMDYIRRWCREHATEGRLADALERIPPEE